MTPGEIKQLASDLGITTKAVRQRIRKHGEAKAAAMPKQTKSQAGRKGRKASPWRTNLVLPGSRS